MKTTPITPISQMPHLDFEDFDRVASLASHMEAGTTELDKEPLGCGKEGSC